MALVRSPARGTVTGTPPPVFLALPGPTLTFRSSSTVTLLVGQSQIRMEAHGSVIIRTSDFFATAMKQEWIEGQTKLIKLPEEDHVHLTYYLEWMYTGKLPTPVYHIRPIFGSLHAHAILPSSYNDSYILLSNLYVLRERMLDTDFRNAVLKEIVRVINLQLSPESPAIKSDIGPPLEVVNTMYQGTTSASSARRLLVDWCLGFGRRSQYTILQEKEFLLDLTKAFSEKADIGLPASEFRSIPLSQGEYVVRKL